jgi:hypothetical protein
VANFKINKCHAFDDYTYFLYYATPVKNLEFFMNSITFGRGSSSAIIPRSPTDRRQAAPLSPVSSATNPNPVPRSGLDRRRLFTSLATLLSRPNRRNLSDRRGLGVSGPLAASNSNQVKRSGLDRRGSSGLRWPLSRRATGFLRNGLIGAALLVGGCTDEPQAPLTPAPQVKQTGQATSTAGPNVSPSPTARPFDSSAYGAPETTVPSNGR